MFLQASLFQFWFDQTRKKSYGPGRPCLPPNRESAEPRVAPLFHAFTLFAKEWDYKDLCKNDVDRGM